MMKALLLHVGIDSTNLGVSAPIFTDQMFEYIPIPEFITKTKYLMKHPNGRLFVWDFDEQEESGEHPWVHESIARAYSDIPVDPSIKGKGHGAFLGDYVPAKFGSAVVHHDPNFDYSTYADRVDDSRGKQLKHLDPEDYLVFVASLAPYEKEAYQGERTVGQIAIFQRLRKAKYLIGYIKVREVYRVKFNTKRFKKDFSNVLRIFPKDKVPHRPRKEIQVDPSIKEQISMNPHSSRDEDEYYIVVGFKEESRRLQFASKITEKSPFKPNETGKRIFRKRFSRGFKWVCEDLQLGNLLAALDASS